jgi:N-acetylglucosamine-6-phosphate deacetylase
MKKEADEHFTIEGVHFETGKPVRINIKNGIIDDISETHELTDRDSEIFIGPGLIDNQINGYANVDFSGDNLSVDKMIVAAHAIWKEGVTSFLPTLITCSHEKLLKNLKILREAVDKVENLRESIPGFHLEGPYISAEEGYRGCHPIRHIRKPSYKELLDYQKVTGGKIMQITLAPEIDGAQKFIRFCTDMGIVVAIGHTNASAEHIFQAVENGARLSTHLGNGCANYIHRHKNPIWPQLADDRLIVTIIADGLHLLPEEVKVFYKVKGRHNLIITSDVIYLAGMAPGRYTFLESEVILTEEGRLINPELDCLAGASFPLKRGVENMISFTGCSLADAVKMASENVALMYGLHDKGNLTRGKIADIILFRRFGNEIKILTTFLKGKIVYQA